MKNSSLRQMVLTAVFAALICVATMQIQVPTLVTNGYVNLGDGFILLAAWILGPVYGFAAGGIGSALADLLLGYASYAPGTFVIKGLIAVVCALVFQGLSKVIKLNVLSQVIAAVIAEAWMVVGYFLYEAFILGYGLPAAASMLSNTTQGIAGVVISVVLVQILIGAKVLDRYGKAKKFA